MRGLTMIGVGGLACFLGAGAAWADFQTGLTAYKRGDFSTAFAEWRTAAEQGHPKAQYGLSMLYAGGEGIRQSPALAVKWCSQAAVQGLAEAQFNLGTLYAAGTVVRQDYPRALAWYRQAAVQGHAEAQFALGLAHYTGRRAPQDFVRAFAWLNLAASQGHPKAALTRDALAARMAPEQVAEARRLARAWRDQDAAIAPHPQFQTPRPHRLHAAQR